MRRLTRTLLADGFRVFVFSFHSPSVMPGGTPYVRTDSELERFLGKCRAYFSFFMRELGGVTINPLEIRKRIDNGLLGSVD
jgi:hypothetical protein